MKILKNILLLGILMVSLVGCGLGNQSSDEKSEGMLQESQNPEETTENGQTDEIVTDASKMVIAMTNPKTLNYQYRRRWFY